MKIFVDENVPQKITSRLREEGYQVEYVTRSVEDRAQIVVNMLRKYKDKLQGTFTSVTESAIDIRRPLL